MRSTIRSFVSTAIGALMFNAVVFGTIYFIWFRPPSIPDHAILQERLSGEMLEYPPGGMIDGLFAPEAATLHGLLENLEKAAADDRIAGVLLELDHPGAGYGMLEEIRGAIAKVRAAGKPVWAWSDNFGFKDLYLAASADSFFVHPNAYIHLGGIRSELLFVKGALDKLGIRSQVVRIEGFKSAPEMYSRRDLSDPAREMLGWIHADLFPRALEGIVAGRGVDPGVLSRALADPLLRPDRVVSSGLADGVREWDELLAALPRAGKEERPRLLAGDTYREIDRSRVLGKGKPRIAVIHAQGLIGGRWSGRDPFLGQVMGHASVRRDLQRALEDDRVVGVVFRVNSRGGESITSDRIARAVAQLDRRKPVVVSMVDVAASGGYNISSGARELVANPSTLTGSIGIYTVKFTLNGLYDRLGLSTDAVSSGPQAGFFSDTRTWSEEDLAAVQENQWAMYRQWIARIAEDRRMAIAEVDSVARGRVWTGQQALDRGLVDRLGGLDTAVAAVREAAGIPEGERVTFEHYPRPQGWLSRFLGLDLSNLAAEVTGRWGAQERERLETIASGRIALYDLPLP